MSKLKRRINTLMSILILVSCHAYAYQISDIQIADTTKISGINNVLSLQGAGIRSKFFVDVYVGAFYAASKISSPELALKDEGPKQMRFHILYKNVSLDSFRKGWTDGIHANNENKIVMQYQNSINEFLSFMDQDFTTGDVITVDYIPGRGTQVTLNGKVKGRVQQEGLYPVLLKTWMGDKPPSKKFRSQLTSIG